mmetsp:Transcript_12717/g.39269  ORF Transcript_12717/g.39269 Transcript_12717/m.39269 type:complete len:450 (-) Transcript_12717:57-1406(-)
MACSPLRFVALCTALARVSGMVHDLVIEKDSRSLYRIESFCFVEGGTLELDVSNFKIDGKGPYRAGFAMRRAESESAAQQELEESLEAGACLLDWKDGARGDGAVFELDLDDKAEWKEKKQLKHVVQKDEEGLYSLVFARCLPKDDKGATSFDLVAKFYNPGPRYLSACEAALPAVFAVFAGLFALAAVAWWGMLVAGWRGAGSIRVHSVHPIMGALLVVKTLTLGSQSLRYHAIDATGSGGGWADAYYVFASLKGVMLFVVILLIGTGWSLVKPYLNDREKKIVLIVLILQVVDNIALVVFEETAPGSRAWLTWRDVLHLVDIICCCAILMPIVWSIRHLREAAAADGKAADTVGKLTLFRQFYIMVVAYIYFTRIIVFLLAATLPFRYLWLRYVFAEGATLIFYVCTGWMFRPREDNPYLPVKREAEMEEFGLTAGDDDEAGDGTIV